MVCERCLDINEDIYCYFIDFTNAFDKVQHIICQKANTRVKNLIPRKVPIARGVREGCVMSSDLFS